LDVDVDLDVNVKRRMKWVAVKRILEAKQGEEWRSVGEVK
jgi:hypothetical protein